MLIKGRMATFGNIIESNGKRIRLITVKERYRLDNNIFINVWTVQEIGQSDLFTFQISDISDINLVALR